MHFLYIIYSETLNRFYTGETHSMQERIKEHNTRKYSKAYTKSANDWKYMLQKECKNKDDAIYLEKFIKRIIENPKILEIKKPRY